MFGVTPGIVALNAAASPILWMYVDSETGLNRSLDASAANEFQDFILPLFNVV